MTRQSQFLAIIQGFASFQGKPLAALDAARSLTDDDLQQLLYVLYYIVENLHMMAMEEKYEAHKMELTKLADQIDSYLDDHF